MTLFAIGTAVVLAGPSKGPSGGLHAKQLFLCAGSYH